MIKKSLIVIMAATALGACRMDKPTNLACGDHNIKIFQKGENAITAVVNDRFSVKMDRVVAGSGAMYLAENVWGEQGDLTYIWQLIIWNRGDEWLVSVDTGYDLSCEVVVGN
ncbi:MAG: MliC family protein [Alphaproteobacteria bacterium]|nr:MliC family protein [Alphaproteobacteria bacterium]